MQKICVIGLGYIGLPTAALLANKGFIVHGVDCIQSVVDTINQGEIHIYEPDLAGFVKGAVSSGRLKAGIEPIEADIFIIAVPTPFKEGKKPDLSYVEAAAKEIAVYIKPGNIVVLESTSPVGTTEKIGKWILERRPDLCIPGYKEEPNRIEQQIYLAHCPERVLPGKIIKELVANDRIIGGINELSATKTMDFYEKFVEGKLLKTDSRTAELSKLTENSFRDVNIAFANELSMICESLDIDVWELITLANRHPRVNILQPGPGVGGHCIAVDPWFIVDSAPEQSNLIHMARTVNDCKPQFIIDKILKYAAGKKDVVIACLGLAFKPNIDDLRESPAMKIVEDLAQKHGGSILAVEPHIRELPNKLRQYQNLSLTSIEKAIETADIIVLLVDHQQFETIDRTMLNRKIVVDTRGLFR